MLITKLTLNNFRVFRGVHEIDLQPEAAELSTTGGEVRDAKPIILFGGLNGAGKTSILTAVRLALYGRQAFNQNLTNSEYIEAITDLIHKGVGHGGVQDNASIALTFTYSNNGKESTYKVTRSWKKDKKDNLSLERDDVVMSELNYEQCQGFLNELIPTGIADLFFFDGEKIAELAEDESGKVLKTAVRRLLGLDVITKLKSDLMIYLKKNDAQALPQTIRDEMNTVEKVRIEHERKSEKLRYEADIVAAQIESTTVDIQRCESDLSQNGGAWAKTRESEALKVDQLLKEKSELEKQLRTEFEGSLPFAFAPNTMKAVIRQIEAEKATKQKQSFSNELNIFLDSLRQDLALRLTNSAVAMETINDSLQAFMNKEQSAELIFDISEREAKLIEFQTQHQATDSFKRFDIARTRLSTVEYELDNASTNIARAPEQEQVQELFTKVRNLDKKKEDLIREYRTLLENAKLELRNALEAARKVQKLHDKNKDAANQGSGISNAQNALILLDKFAEQLTHARVKQLEKEFVSSYKNLARKDDLHITAVINPQTFDVNLVDEHGIKINRKAMSAGEKQIYAISILEALGRTSGRKLPIIIDTPLGRLDSHHRDKLVENYFPNASHQVVILSTDTEIDKDYINMIQDDIAQTYEISFDGLTKSSKIKTGYFWKDKLQEAM